MDYKIVIGDKFLCIKDYIMDSKEVAYTKGKVYISERMACITDNELDMLHVMEDMPNFFECFKLVSVEFKPKRKKKKCKNQQKIKQHGLLIQIEIKVTGLKG